MNKNHITILIIIVVLIAVGGFFVLQDNEADAVDVEIETGQNPSDGSTTVEVPHNDDGVFDGTSGVNEMIVVGEETDDGTMMENSERIVVTYTDSGFVPKEINIAKGQTVTWVNESKRSMWVASAMHPTHTAYPETSANDCLGSSFDACAGSGTESTWNFTFNTNGEWGYHDHLRVANWGRVIVQ